MNDVLPNYVPPSLSQAHSSLESCWRYPQDFGEACPPPSDSQLYPRLTPVYNGKVLDLKAEFVHASLSGISIKHYYGKCMKEPEHDHKTEGNELFADNGTEGFDYDWLEEEEVRQNTMSMTNMTKDNQDFSGDSTSSSSGSFEYRDSFCVEGQPLCTLPKINYRNSFWNIHRPELCKLTWGQKYVGTSTVTEHLHEHLLQHGNLCEGFHTKEDMESMLNRELDDYVRLKVLQESRKLPPDEPLFDFKYSRKIVSKSIHVNPKCKGFNDPKDKVLMDENERFVQLTDDEDEENDTRIRRSKEEFCLTIGRHTRKPHMVQEEEEAASDRCITPQLSSAAEEVSGVFYYNWFLYNREDDEYEGESDTRVESASTTTSDFEPLVEPCPPLMMDEFCRAAGKVDFSDLRCNPDL